MGAPLAMAVTAWFLKVLNETPTSPETTMSSSARPETACRLIPWPLSDSANSLPLMWIRAPMARLPLEVVARPIFPLRAGFERSPKLLGTASAGIAFLL